MKKLIMIIVAVLLAAAIAGGSFYGGMAYQQNQANAVRENFLRDRGLNGNAPGAGNFPGGGQNGARGGNFIGRGMEGEVVSLEGNTLTLNAFQNEMKVTLTNDTSILKTTEGTTADLQPGQQVLVTGERDADGNLTAVQITIMSNAGSQTTTGDAP